ncbi:threonine/serine exporter family protein [Clostridium sp. UBA4548]|uniref:threonine/serine exporter family protein n=1 Tax=Clostridium sp. UBA4548 TaxID=1946361 RepID=UPI0025B9BCE4|nr:threonine/serine exporter family protein [Clostridium sp. UBA4548]
MISVLYAFISSLGFGILFNVRGKNLIIASIGGGLGWLFYLITKNSTGSEIVALFVASIVISVFSEIFARIMKNPVTIFLICALIPLVPGGGMYYTTFEAVQGNVSKSIVLGIQTLFNAASIAVGIILVSTISKIINKLKFNKLESLKK